MSEKYSGKVEVIKFELPVDSKSKLIKDDAYDYRDVIFTYENEGMARVHRFQKKGWEIVYDTEIVTTDGKTEQRMQPVVTNKKPVHKAVFMRCLKTRREKNEADKRKANYEKVMRSIKLKVDGQHHIMNDTNIANINDLPNNSNINDLED